MGQRDWSIVVRISELSVMLGSFLQGVTVETMERGPVTSHQLFLATFAVRDLFSNCQRTTLSNHHLKG